MAILKCKMCGGSLNILEGVSTAECEYCGSIQTVPNLDDEKKLIQFERAERLRKQCEFDKAAGIYESIVAEFRQEAEAYWGLVLCKYGIEYVDDPATGAKVPTCHRSGYESVLDDHNLEQAMENADMAAQKVYRAEAKQFERIRKGILEVSSAEKPYDIFICYKETDETGSRTLDSVLAQDLYGALTDKGYRVFFSRITLQGKLGEAYEPYIFAALNSAKVMLAVGTCYEYYNAVWVKNEWSRYLKLCQNDRTKHLIPCYKDLDPEDMPREFNHLQGADLGKMGAIQDILFNMEKYIPLKKQEETIINYAAVAQQPSTANYIKRGNMAMEDGNFENARKFFEDALNLDAECAEAYLGLAMCKKKVSTLEDLVGKNDWNDSDYRRGKQFATADLQERLRSLETEQQAKRNTLEEQNRQKNATILKNLQERSRKADNLIAIGAYHTVAVKTDGTAVATRFKGQAQFNYGQCEVGKWQNLIAVSAGEFHTVGLKADGTVVATGADTYGQCQTSTWTGIIAIAAGDTHTVGLKSDGTVVATQYKGDNKKNFGQCDVSGWRGIVAIFAKGHHTMGLKSDGTVVATGERAAKIRGWTDIVALSGTGLCTVGLKSDGTVVAVGSNENGQCDVGDWKDIISISTALRYTVGLKSDGTVVTTKFIGKSDFYFGEREVQGWKNVVAVAARTYHTVGVRSDGTVVAVGTNSGGQCDVGSWKLFQSLDTLEQERQLAETARLKKAREEEEERRATKQLAEEIRRTKERWISEAKRDEELQNRRMAAGLCQYCGGEFKGLFTKRCICCGRPKGY